MHREKAAFVKIFDRNSTEHQQKDGLFLQDSTNLKIDPTTSPKQYSHCCVDLLRIKSSLHSFMNLRIGIGGTSLLAGNTKNGVHVVVTHISSLGGHVLWAHGDGKVLGGDCLIRK